MHQISQKKLLKPSKRLKTSQAAPFYVTVQKPTVHVQSEGRSSELPVGFITGKSNRPHSSGVPITTL